MNLLVVTNLYPPQELGGYGRSIADFVWGLRERGHCIQVLSSDAPHLGASSSLGPSGEAVDRGLKLKGSYEGGVHPLQDPQQRQSIDEANAVLIRAWLGKQHWDGILLGNLDLLGPELLPALLEAPCIVQHHVGFVHAPFPPRAWPQSDRYRLVAASAVRSALRVPAPPEQRAWSIPVYAMNFSNERLGMPMPLAPDGSRNDRSRLLRRITDGQGSVYSIEALIQHDNKDCVQATAGDSPERREQLPLLEQRIWWQQFVGQLGRLALARFTFIMSVFSHPFTRGFWTCGCGNDGIRASRN